MFSDSGTDQTVRHNLLSFRWFRFTQVFLLLGYHKKISTQKKGALDSHSYLFYLKIELLVTTLDKTSKSTEKQELIFIALRSFMQKLYLKTNSPNARNNSLRFYSIVDCYSLEQVYVQSKYAYFFLTHTCIHA